MRAHFIKWLTDGKGTALANATVTLRQKGTATPITETIFAGDTGDNTVLANPLSTDSAGKIEFYLDNAKRLDLFVEKSGYTSRTFTVDVLKLPSSTLVEEGGVLSTNRTTLNFDALGFTLTDDPTNDETDIVLDSIRGHSDVSDAPPADGQVLVWRDVGGAYVPEAIAGGETVSAAAIWDAKGDLAVGTGPDAAARLAIGAEGTSPVARAAAATGIAWEAIAGGASHFILRKTADETITSSSTLQDDDHLTFPIAANEIWVGYMFLEVGPGDESADIKYDISVPTGATLVRGMHGLVGTTTTYFADLQALDPGPGITSWGIDDAERTVAIIYFTVTNGATAGNVTLRWSQNAVSATGTTLKAGSHLVAHKVG